MRQKEASGLWSVTCDDCGKRGGAGSNPTSLMNSLNKVGWGGEWSAGRGWHYCRLCWQARKERGAEALKAERERDPLEELR